MAPELQLRPFSAADVEPFLAYAAGEGWITDRCELAFLRCCCPHGCLAAVVDGEPAAFIMAMQYAASAWVGNLLVAPHHRRQGLGRLLMNEVLQRFDSSGTETVWLTASSDGAPLYRTLGFVPIDTIERWRTTGSLQTAFHRAVDLEPVAVLDAHGWGDSRARLFAGIQDCAGWLLRKDGFLRCLPVGAGLQLGPWGALSGRGAAELLATTMKAVSGEGAIFLDSPQQNRAAARLLQMHGFTRSGETLLMYRGTLPAYRPELVYALASMGSYG